MNPRNIPNPSPLQPRNDGDDADMSMASPAVSPTDTSYRTSLLRPPQPISPARYATTTNAFGLATSPSSSASSSTRDYSLTAVGMTLDNSPPSAGTFATKKLRRPSMLSLAQTANVSSDTSFTEGNSTFTRLCPATAALIPPLQDPSSSQNPLRLGQPRSVTSPFASHGDSLQSPRWNSAPFLAHSLIKRTSSAPPLALDSLRAHTLPIVTNDTIDEGRASPMKLEGNQADVLESKSPLRSVPSHLQTNQTSRRKGKARMDDLDLSTPSNPTTLHAPPFTGRPLPASLLATLISESSPLEHEMRSEARLQRLLSSHPQALPLTPSGSRANRGRFPETVGDDDDDDDLPGVRNHWSRRSWMGRASSSDSDSDEAPMKEPTPEPVNFAFAAGMDMDRIECPKSSSSFSTGGYQLSGGQMVSRSNSSGGSASGQPTTNPTPPNQPWPKAAPRLSFGSAGAGMVPSPGVGTGLPNAFGSLGMSGTGTPVASPTIEKLELAGSPGTLSVASPGLMQYRESQGGSASVRPGKRKAAQDDRFDPYKRPRGSSPSFLASSPALSLSPSRSTPAIPIPHSPSHAPLYSSTLSSFNNNGSLASRQNRPAHPYTRPIASRSRAASPALSIGSTSGVLSTSLGNNNNGNGAGRPSFSLGQAFIPTGSGSGGIVQQGSAPQGLGGLGLLSLNRDRRDASDEGQEAMEIMREDPEHSREAMEED